MRGSVRTIDDDDEAIDDEATDDAVDDAALDDEAIDDEAIDDAVDDAALDDDADDGAADASSSSRVSVWDGAFELAFGALGVAALCAGGAFAGIAPAVVPPTST